MDPPADPLKSKSCGACLIATLKDDAEREEHRRTVHPAEFNAPGDAVCVFCRAEVNTIFGRFDHMDMIHSYQWMLMIQKWLKASTLDIDDLEPYALALAAFNEEHDSKRNLEDVLASIEVMWGNEKKEAALEPVDEAPPVEALNLNDEDKPEEEQAPPVEALNPEDGQEEREEQEDHAPKTPLVESLNPIDNQPREEQADPTDFTSMFGQLLNARPIKIEPRDIAITEPLDNSVYQELLKTVYTTTPMTAGQQPAAVDSEDAPAEVPAEIPPEVPAQIPPEVPEVEAPAPPPIVPAAIPQEQPIQAPVRPPPLKIQTIFSDEEDEEDGHQALANHFDSISPKILPPAEKPVMTQTLANEAVPIDDNAMREKSVAVKAREAAVPIDIRDEKIEKPRTITNGRAEISSAAQGDTFDQRIAEDAFAPILRSVAGPSRVEPVIQASTSSTSTGKENNEVGPRKRPSGDADGSALTMTLTRPAEGRESRVVKRPRVLEMQEQPVAAQNVQLGGSSNDPITIDDSDDEEEVKVERREVEMEQEGSDVDMKDVKDCAPIDGQTYEQMHQLQMQLSAQQQMQPSATAVINSGGSVHFPLTPDSSCADGSAGNGLLLHQGLREEKKVEEPISPSNSSANSTSGSGVMEPANKIDLSARFIFTPELVTILNNMPQQPPAVVPNPSMSIAASLAPPRPTLAIPQPSLFAPIIVVALDPDAEFWKGNTESDVCPRCGAVVAKSGRRKHYTQHHYDVYSFKKYNVEGSPLQALIDHIEKSLGTEKDDNRECLHCPTMIKGRYRLLVHHSQKHKDRLLEFITRYEQLQAACGGAVPDNVVEYVVKTEKPSTSSA